MVVLPFTGASCYHNCCIDGGTNLEYFGCALIDTPSHLVIAYTCVIHFKSVHLLNVFEDGFAFIIQVRNKNINPLIPDWN
jgi:hypothetical protein